MPPGEDTVSGALNVPGFGMGFARALATGNIEKLALWYIDMKNFRSVNPNFGFLSGNVVLRSLADGIKKFLAGDLPVARLGADRFILMSRQLEYDQAKDAFADMIAWVCDDLEKKGINYPVVLSSGIYYLRGSDFEARDFKKALDYASIAHRKARVVPSSALVLFTDEDLERDNRRILIEQSIDDALEQGQIEVWYQPQVDYVYGEIIGAEALARWNHPDLGWISPTEFVPVLEKCGRVHDLDLFVWEEACRSAGRWYKASDGSPVPISVNVSRVEMFEEGLMEHFLELQDKYDLPEGSLRLEVTESAFVEEAERLYSIIEEIRANKLPVEMDDFGSGLSSLHMLKDVPVDVVKLDMGFMRTAVNEDRGGVVLGSVIRMLQGLDTPIIAEGVETLEQAEMLKNMGCRFMQGFHFSKPMPLGDFENFISSNNAAVDTIQRARKDSRLEEIMSFDSTSSFLFNNVVGGMMVFIVNGESSESLLVNDAFYEECGLKRDEFGNAKVNPIHEIDDESRETLWRAAAEARENGSAMCSAKVRLSGRWIECVMRHISSSTRGEVFALIICRSGSIVEEGAQVIQVSQDAEWNIGLLREIVPSGFLKCEMNDSLTISYLSPEVLAATGFSREDFVRGFHNSLMDAIVPDDRQAVYEAVRAAASADEMVDLEFAIYRGFDSELNVQMLGRARADEAGTNWLYALLLFKYFAADGEKPAGMSLKNRIIPFDYRLADDHLAVRLTLPDGTEKTVEFSNWLAQLDSLPEYISASSASMILAMVQDLRHHPISGFTDLKCNLSGSDSLRWFHVNYTCETDRDGNTTVIHGYAQDANDQMGSAKWWRRQAESDYLTGLLNRNAIEQEINLSMRREGSGMMLMIDLDNFKRINDDLGHLTGDALLRDVADALSRHFRDSDFLGRYGGDEFVAFMPVKPENAYSLAEKRAQDIISDVSKVTASDGTHAACSVGVAICNNRNATFHDLLASADQAMYESKLKGKGRYTIHTME